MPAEAPAVAQRQRMDGAVVSGGWTAVTAPVLLARTQEMLDARPRLGLAAVGLYVLLATGWDAWRRRGHMDATMAGIARATGVSEPAVRRCMGLLAAHGLVGGEDGHWVLSGEVTPHYRGQRMRSGSHALRLAHHEIWRIREDLAGRADVGPYHHLRDLGAHIVALAQDEARSQLALAADPRTGRRRARRLAAAGLCVLEVLRRRAARVLKPAVAPVGLPPDWRTWLRTGQPQAPPLPS